MERKLVFLYDIENPRDTEPALAAARQLLAECAEKREPLPAADLSRTLVILPGRRAVRTVSAFLAEFGPVLPPVFATPGSFLRMGTEDRQTACAAEQKAVWMDLLKKRGASSLPSLFPTGLPDDAETLSWHADRIMALRRELGQSVEYGSFAQTCSILESGSDGRWIELRSLESEYRAALAAAGLSDPLDLEHNALRNIFCFGTFRRIVAALTPDLPPLVKARLDALASSSTQSRDPGTDVPRIRVYVAASGKDRSLFDEWGCVIPEKWSGAALPFEGPAGRIHAASDPKEMAELAVRLAPNPESGVFDLEKTAVVVTDASFVPELADRFVSFRTTSGGPLPVYDPGGVPMRNLRLVPLLSVFRTLISDAASPDLPADAVKQLLGLDCVVSYLSHEADFPPDELLRFADLTFLARLPDSFHQDNLPDGMMSPHDRRMAEGFLAFRRALDKIAEMRRRLLSAEHFFASLREILTSVFYLEHYDLKYGIPLEDEVAVLRNLLDVFEASPILSGRTPGELLFLLSDAMSGEALYSEHEPEALEITGFLDMPFRSAKRVILCGMNEGALPESLPPTPFLNDSLRSRLGLPDNASRYARDCFYLKCLMERTGGDVHFIVCKTGADGTPLRASSLFFSGPVPTAELLKRAAVLFESYPLLPAPEMQRLSSMPFRRAPDFRRAFLRDGVITLRVTQFKDLLASPLRAWMTCELGMEDVDYLSPELSPASLGTFVHGALQRFEPEAEWIRSAAGDDPVLQAQAVEAASQRLYALFLREMKKVLGDRLPLLPMIQAEMWEMRLRKTAECLLKESCEVVEREWSLNEGRGIGFGDARILGKIDRIEYDRKNRMLRLIDFKTGAEAEDPAAAHIKEKRFIDLQLPLYVLLLRRDESFRKKHPELASCLDDTNPIRCGYFAISQTVGKIGYCFWDGMEAVLPAAERTAELAVETIRLMHQGVLPEDLSRTVSYDFCANLFLPSLKDVFGNIVISCDPPEWPAVSLPRNAGKGGAA